MIEVMGCCEEAATGLVGELDELLPNARVVTISQIVQAQVTVNRLMNRLSYVIFGILMLIGGASIASVMFANVAERRRELGTLMALGATPGDAVWTVGLSGMRLVALGLLVGGLISIGVGRIITHVIWGVTPLDPITIAGTIICLAALGGAASFGPAARLLRMDPSRILQES